MIAYGPVPSRRLGRSLGINNIPPKSCTYACIYCQVGHTTEMKLERREFYPPDDLFRSVTARVKEVTMAGDRIDYLSFVPDGEPTLDVNLGQEIDLLRELHQPIAVITNSSLLSQGGVREDLAKADWVSLKVDAVEEESWRRLNHPHRALDLPAILDGITEFAGRFTGTLVTETMLVAGVNDTDSNSAATAEFLSGLKPSTAYLSVPTRPPTLNWVRPPNTATLLQCFQAFEKVIPKVEYLLGYEGNAFSWTGDPTENLLGIAAVHPMREDAVAALLKKAKAPWLLVEQLIADGGLLQIEYAGHRYYLRSPRFF